MKGQIIVATNSEKVANYGKLKDACGGMGVPYNTVTSYFRRYPKEKSYTHKKTGVTLTKTVLL